MYNRPPSLSRITLGHPTLLDTRRLVALKSVAMIDTPAEPMFDRMTYLATRLLNAPTSLISLIDGNRQWFKSLVGLQDPWGTRRETPLSYSICQYVVTSQKPLALTDSRQVDFLRGNLGVSELNIVAYLGMPLTTANGQTLGALCVIDNQPRQWTMEEVDILQSLSETTISLIEMRAQIMASNH